MVNVFEGLWDLAPSGLLADEEGNVMLHVALLEAETDALARLIIRNTDGGKDVGVVPEAVAEVVDTFFFEFLEFLQKGYKDDKIWVSVEYVTAILPRHFFLQRKKRGKREVTYIASDFPLAIPRSRDLG